MLLRPRSRGCPLQEVKEAVHNPYHILRSGALEGLVEGDTHPPLLIRTLLPVGIILEGPRAFPGYLLCPLYTPPLQEEAGGECLIGEVASLAKLLCSLQVLYDAGKLQQGPLSVGEVLLEGLGYGLRPL